MSLAFDLLPYVARAASPAYPATLPKSEFPNHTPVPDVIAAGPELKTPELAA